MKAPKLLLTTLLLLTFFNFAAGADRTVTGNISVAETGGPLPGTQILIKGTFTGTITDNDGNYIINIPVDEVTFIVTFIGFKTQEITLAPGVTSLDIEMEEDVLKTSGVVVTGLASTVKKRNLAHSVATISADELIPAPAQTLGGALAGKFAGINVSQNTGAPGGGISVNLRGVSTLVGATQPLYVIDGVIINNAANLSGLMDLITAAASAGSPTPQGQPVNRIADINPNDIANIEVLKGASAAAIYGSKAAGGVIIITTKSGGTGKTRIDVSQQLGFSTILNKIGHRKWTAASAEEVYGAEGLATYNQNVETRGIGLIDYEDELYGETGMLWETTVSARGGTNKTQFYVSGMYKNDEGIVKNTGYKKYSAKINVKHRFSEKTKLDVYTSLIRSESDRAITGNDNTNTTFGFSLAFTPSFLDIRKCNEADVGAGSARSECSGLLEGDYPVHPFNPSNPLHTRDVLTNNEIVYRSILSTKLTHSLYRTTNQNLDFIVQAGVDFYSQENKAFSPPDLQFERVSDTPGSSILGEAENVNSNLYLNLVHKYVTPSNTSYNTTFGFQFENIETNNLVVWATNLIPTQTNVDQASKVVTIQDITRQRERGFFIQQEVNFNDVIYVSGGLRGDRSSTIGDTDKFFMFPKGALSYRLNDALKLRTAYGVTGNLPIANSKFTLLDPISIGGNSGLINEGTRGSADIKPERTQEIELGLDWTGLDEKATLDATYFTQNITDLLLTADFPASSGYQFEIVNGGEMKTSGIELSLGLNLIRSQNTNWLSRINFYRTRSEITELDVDPYNTGGFATFLGTYRIEKGVSPTRIVGSETDADGNHVELGDETPDFQMSFNNSLRFGNFNLGFLWDWKKGGDVINLGKLLTDLGGTSGDYDTVEKYDDDNDPATPDVDLINGVGRLTVLGVQTAPYIEDGSYWKLRELNLSYNFSEQTVQGWFGGRLTYLRIGISGRNLLMFADYLGYDPEVSQFGNRAIGRSVDTIPFPTAKSFFFNVSFGM
ncbi:MAG: SusC/RagA family TonB-linked outer membrane protein [Candidatus Marinimicrobia bacterium]|nr:SusC/RagA family TonB-linked outer membrane protein [Candidatus Neomarinimicrobiota bacterium]